MMTKEELLSLSLPKWPQCIVTGTTISREQALEIIRRTDKFFDAPMYANDRTRMEKIMMILNIPQEPDRDDAEEFDKAFTKYWEDIRKWKDNWGYISLQYLDNDWVLSDMLQGAQGWCNPDGRIDYHYNIGKWPESSEVLEELELIASTWPFLELECTLMNREYGEEDSKPIISFLVRNGSVEVVDPQVRNIHEEFNRDMWAYSEGETLSKFMNVLRGGGGSDSRISLETIRSWTPYTIDKNQHSS